jgi:uncharacterized protein
MWNTMSLADDSHTTENSSEFDKNVDFTWGVKIPLSDGLYLNATLYKPKDSRPTTAIFTLTPYISDSYHPRAFYFARHGYAFLLVDCRGRGNSEGEFEPFVNEGRDGHDIVEWLAAQPWCDGSVTMWGGSYGGFNQWMTLKEFPPALKTIVPAASAHAAVDFPFLKNIFYTYVIRWLTFTTGLTGNANLFNERTFWNEKYYELHANHIPFRDLDRVTGNLDSHFRTWLAHPTPDAYWDRMALTPAEYDRIDLPILTITGHYDGDQPGAMHYYRSHMASDSPARDRHYLIIGPWDHPGTRTPNREHGGLKFAEACLVDLNKLHHEWYAWTMKDGPRPEFLKDRVAYYLAGAEEWKYAPSLEALSTSARRLCLDSSGSAGDVFQSGLLAEEPPTGSSFDSYTYDPLDLRPGELERDGVDDYLTDQRAALHLFDSGFVYHSRPLETDLDLAGCVKFTAWLELDAPDADFQVTLYEILLDGSSILLTQDMLRARYRRALREETPATPGEIDRYDFEGFTFFARRLARGSRMRLLFRSINSIFVQKNYNSGGVVADESRGDARVVNVKLYHNEEYQSYLELPVVETG